MAGARPLVWFVTLSALILVRITPLHCQSSREEIPLQISVPGIGSTMVPVLIDDRGVLLPIADVFSFMQIRIDVSADGGVLSGFIMREESIYSIDPATRRARVAGRDEHLPAEDIVTTEERTYVRSDLFGPLFGLDCSFDMRALEVRFARNNDIPAVRALLRSKQRLETAENNDPANVPVDREVAPTPAAGNLGALDWGVTASTSRDGIPTSVLSLDCGGELIGGSVEASLLLLGEQPTTWRTLTARWHRLLDLPAMLPQQVVVGTLGGMASGPMLGARVTNTNPIGRRGFGTYVISDRTEAAWVVELYLNHQLVDIVRTDQTGEYRFEIPLWYGTTRATLKFYGPYGEERTHQRTIIIPYTFLPSGEVEYSGAVGAIVEQASTIPAADFKVGIGVTSWLSFGANMEWEERGLGRDLTHAYTAALRIGDNMLCEGSYAPGSFADGSIAMVLPFRSSFDIRWRADMVPGNAQNDVRANLDIPIPALLGSLDLSGSYRTIGPSSFRRGGASLNGSVAGVPVSLSASLEWTGIDRVELVSARSRLAASLFLPFGPMVRPIAEVDWLSGSIIAASLEANIPLSSGTALFGTVTRVTETALIVGTFGARLDLPFTNVSTHGISTAGGTVTRTSATGSIWMDTEGGTTLVRGASSIGRGGVTVRPFLDRDNDGVRDNEEPLLPNTSVTINGGVVTSAWGDSLIRVLDLEPYIPYVMTISAVSFENLNWRPRWSTWRIRTLPNVFETIDVPIVITGEVEGSVVRRVGGVEAGVAGMRVRFRASDGNIVDSTVTESGGGFLHIGLAPGDYRAELDSDQLRRMRMSCDTPSIPITIRATDEGDLVEGLTFVVTRWASAGSAK